MGGGDAEDVQPRGLVGADGLPDDAGGSAKPAKAHAENHDDRQGHESRAVRAAGRGAMTAVIVASVVGSIVGGALGVWLAFWLIGKAERGELR